MTSTDTVMTSVKYNIIHILLFIRNENQRIHVKSQNKTILFMLFFPFFCICLISMILYVYRIYPPGPLYQPDKKYIAKPCDIVCPSLQHTY